MEILWPRFSNMRLFFSISYYPLFKFLRVFFKRRIYGHWECICHNLNLTNEKIFIIILVWDSVSRCTTSYNQVFSVWGSQELCLIYFSEDLFLYFFLNLGHLCSDSTPQMLQLFHLLFVLLFIKPVTCRHFCCLDKVIYVEKVTRDIKKWLLHCFLSSLFLLRGNPGHGH